MFSATTRSKEVWERSQGDRWWLVIGAGSGELESPADEVSFRAHQEGLCLSIWCSSDGSGYPTRAGRGRFHWRHRDIGVAMTARWILPNNWPNNSVLLRRNPMDGVPATHQRTGLDLGKW